jgi:hypothetical protein
MDDELEPVAHSRNGGVGMSEFHPRSSLALMQ